VTLTERALDKALTIFREAGVMPPTDHDGWARINGKWVRLEIVSATSYTGKEHYSPLYRVVKP
jgi:hypothetical protein